MEEKKVTQSNRMWTKSNVQTPNFMCKPLDIDLPSKKLLSPNVISRLHY